MCWRILLEEYGPTFVYKKGPENFIADAISRVPTSRTSPNPPSNPVYYPSQDPHDPHDDPEPKTENANATDVFYTIQNADGVFLVYNPTHAVTFLILQNYRMR